jgi:2-polyprenyl-3-methyl-5-hydroxy-6-metoxy-1,4-benzoquinol methylase
LASGTPSGWAGSILGRWPPIWRRATYGQSKLLLPCRPHGKLLDIGCGNGDYLALMQLLGWDVYGIEIDPVAAAVARDRLNCAIHIGSIENCPFPEQQFQKITCSYVLEHVPDPTAFVVHAEKLLEPGGRMVTVTPNFSCLGHKLLGRDWYP